MPSQIATEGVDPDVVATFEDCAPTRSLPACRWTDGYWDFGPGLQRRWNEIQNTSKDVHLLANYLLIQYRRETTVAQRANGLLVDDRS